MLPQVSNGDMTEAVAFLTEKNAQGSQQDKTGYYQTAQASSDRYISVGSQADTSEQLGNVHTLNSLPSTGLLESQKQPIQKGCASCIKGRQRETRQNRSHL